LSPVDGCQEPPRADIRGADAFAFPLYQKGVEEGTFWSSQSLGQQRGYSTPPPSLPSTTCAPSLLGTGRGTRNIPERGSLMGTARKTGGLTPAELRSEGP